jgi:calcium permeable stress-gated cation channel
VSSTHEHILCLSLIFPSLRPKPLGNSLWAFLFPHVPFVPSIPKDVSNAGRSSAVDAHLFPSDEQLSQRTLWTCFLIVLGWTLLGLGGALPLYLVSTPCLAQSAPPGNSSGVYSTMQDLSLMRLLQLLDSGNITTTNFSGLHTREIVDNNDLYHNTYIRLIVLTVLVVVFAILPALWKILHEFNRIVAYRKRWITVRCEGKEMAWLSARDAPGFIGWGEQRLKSFILKSGLSNAFEMSRGMNGRRGQDRRGGDGERPLTREEEANLEVDVQSLFSVGDTQRLALLIEDRDEILENLEIAETRYIISFRLSTPEPSIADFEPPMILENKDRPQISRPRALAGATARRRRRRHNPAYAASSLAPTSFVAPSQYYKLRGVQGVSGGRLTDIDSQQNFSDSIHQRVIGTRFQEVNRNSQAYGRLPIGSHVRLEKSGELGPGSPETPSSPFLSRHGPNYDQESWIQGGESRFLSPQSRYVETPDVEPTENGDLDDEWVDLVHEAPIDFSEDHNQMQPSTSTHGPGGYDEIGVARRRLPKIFQVRQTTEDSARRETFPLRNRDHDPAGITSPVPPHLRLQQQQPFVRPVSGVNHSDLGSVYSDISQWRSRLKTINAEIEEAQRKGYNDIADGTSVKGWLMVGRGLRFIPGAQLIEGRAKEDIRWDVLQNERSTLDSAVLWTVVAIVAVLLAAGRTCFQFIIHYPY